MFVDVNKEYRIPRRGIFRLSGLAGLLWLAGCTELFGTDSKPTETPGYGTSTVTPGPTPTVTPGPTPTETRPSESGSAYGNSMGYGTSPYGSPVDSE